MVQIFVFCLLLKISFSLVCNVIFLLLSCLTGFQDLWKTHKLFFCGWYFSALCLTVNIGPGVLRLIPKLLWDSPLLLSVFNFILVQIIYMAIYLYEIYKSLYWTHTQTCFCLLRFIDPKMEDFLCNLNLIILIINLIYLIIIPIILV